MRVLGIENSRPGPERDLLEAVDRQLRENPALNFSAALSLVTCADRGLVDRYSMWVMNGRERQDHAVSPEGGAVLPRGYPTRREDIPETVQLSDRPRFVVSLSRVRLSDADQPSRIPLATIGTFYKGKQKFSITKADVARMSENFAKRGTGDVVLDYEHASEEPEVAQGGPVPAAGWITSIDSEPDANGVVWGSVQFTEKARAMVAAKEYKYISPVIDWGVRDRRTGDVQGATLTSAALTNRPVLDHMPAIQLSDAGWTKV